MVLPDLSHLSPEEQLRFRQSPALDPPSDATRNLENPSNGNAEYRAFLVFCIILTTLCAFGRFYGTWCSSRKFFFSDGMFLIGLGAYFTYMGFVLDSINQVGYLIHQWDVIFEDVLYMLYSFSICPILYAIVTMVTKIAILGEWLRIFNPTGHRGYFWWSTSIMLGSTVMYYVTAMFLHSFACRPFAKSYNPFIPGDCIDVQPVYLSSAIINMGLDLGILVLPLHVIWNLQMTRERKLGVGIVFAFGILAVVCATLRVPTTIRWMRSKDLLYETSVIGIIFTAEMTAGFLVFCIPSLPKAFVGLGLPKLIPNISSFFASTYRSQRSRHKSAWLGDSDDSSEESDDFQKDRGQPDTLQTIGGTEGGKLNLFKKSKRYTDTWIHRDTQFTIASPPSKGRV